MKKIVIIFVLLSVSVAAYAGEPYVKTYHEGKNWTVMEVGFTGEFKQCALKSAPFYLDNGKNPKYGTTFLEISYPSNDVTFSGENTGAYFKISKKTTLQVDDGPSTSIIPGKPKLGKSIIDDMKKGRTAKITVDFGGGPPDIHTFSLLGFSASYNMLQDCSGVLPKKKAAEIESHHREPRTVLTLSSFLASGFAKQYGISKQDGWALRDGSYNNDLSVSRLQGAMLSASTKGDRIVEAGVMFIGTSSLDTSKMSFVLALFKALDSNTAHLHIKDSISKSLSNRVSQIKQAPAQTYGNLRVHAANVGGDAVISIELQ